jgi:Methyltransferase domain
VLGDAPFWPVDHLAAPDAWVGHIPFAFWIVDALRPRLLVELGTHSGNSYFALAQAVHRLGLGTSCFAVDTWRGDDQAGYYGEEVFQELSRYHDAHYGAFSRLVRSTFDEALQHFPDASVDLLHLDGCHTYEAVAHDFAMWRPKLSARAVVLLHDTNVRERDFGVWRLWDELRPRHPHFEFLHAHGLGVLGVGSDLPAAVTALWQTTGDVTRAVRIREVFARLGSFAVERLQLRARVEGLQNEVEHLAEAVRTALQEVAARDELIKRAAAEHASIDEAAQDRDQSRVAEIEAQLRRINGLQHEIDRLGQEVAARDDLIRKGAEERAAIEEAARGRDQSRVAEIDARLKVINGLERELDEQLRQINELRHEIDEQVKLINGLQHEIVRLGTLRETDRLVLGEVQEHLQRVERERAEASGEAEALRAALSALHQSRSLRLTRPLRQAAGWYRTAVAWARRGARSP